MQVYWYFRFLMFCVAVDHGVTAKKSKVFSRTQLYMRFRYAGECEDYPGDVKGENFTISNIGAKCVINGIAHVYRQMDLAERTVVIFRKCNDAAQDKTCELFQTWRFGRETCQLVEQKNALWSPLFLAFHPQPKCPIKKGIYTVTNATLDLSAIINIFGSSLLEKHFWRVRINVFDQKLFAGICFGVSFLRGKA